MSHTDTGGSTPDLMKSGFSLGSLLSRNRSEARDPIIDARIEGLATNLEAKLPKQSCFRH